MRNPFDFKHRAKISQLYSSDFLLMFDFVLGSFFSKISHGKNKKSSPSGTLIFEGPERNRWEFIKNELSFPE